MANLQNHITNNHVNYMTGIGQKVKHLANLGAKVKGAYDTARTIYSLAQAAAPYVMPLLGAI
jgi:phage-related protein